MAKSKVAEVVFQGKPKRSRPGVVAKTKNSKLKTSKMYKKRYRGQGR
jgi:hypothetical protein